MKVATNEKVYTCLFIFVKQICMVLIHTAILLEFWGTTVYFIKFDKTFNPFKCNTIFTTPYPHKPLTHIFKNAYTHVYSQDYTDIYTCVHTCLQTCLHPSLQCLQTSLHNVFPYVYRHFLRICFHTCVQSVFTFYTHVYTYVYMHVY